MMTETTSTAPLVDEYNIAGDWVGDFSELGGQTKHRCPVCSKGFLGSRERYVCAMCIGESAARAHKPS